MRGLAAAAPCPTAGHSPTPYFRQAPGSRQATGRGRLTGCRGILVGIALLLGACGLPRWPVSGPITSPYGLRLVGWSPEVHHGVDIAVPDGTPVRAMSGGSVAFAGRENGYGLLVVLRHRGSTRTLYGHLSELRVRLGDRVAGGQVIGLSGHSGNARGPHLHFEVQRWGAAEDPVPLLGGHP